MKKNINEFHDHIMYDRLSHIPNITSKRMFGGYGIYQDGIIFAIITSEKELYFKADISLEARFKTHDSRPFVYTGHKNRKPTTMPYWLLPEEILEDKEKIIEWVHASVETSKKLSKKK